MNEICSEAATGADFDLAEGVIWDDRAQLVRWVDITRGLVYSGQLGRGRIQGIAATSIGQTAGAVALAEDGGLLVAGARGLVSIDPEGRLDFGPDILHGRTTARLNDGSVDRYGAFVCGSLALSDRKDGQVLLRVWPNGRIEVLREEVGLSNGIAFSPDGGTIYHVDTFAGTVSKHSYGRLPIDSAEEWVTVIDDFPAYPDGLVVDAEGALWIAQWGGGSVRRHAPTGDLLAVVRVDAPQVTCPGFVGPQLDILAITTAKEGLDGDNGHSGAIFLADSGVKGLPANRWAGRTSGSSYTSPEREVRGDARKSV